MTGLKAIPNILGGTSIKLIIAGSRNLDEEALVEQLKEMQTQNHDLVKAVEIVSGGAAGADRAGEIYATGQDLPIKRFPADWGTHGKAAGPIRNKQMAEYADALLVFWDGVSAGTKNMIDHMYRKKKPVYIVKCSTTDKG